MAGIGFENALNYRAFPGSNIGRAVAYFHVRFADMRNSNGKLDVQNFRTAVQVIQTGAEVLWTSVPYVSDSYGAFQVAVSYDTANEFPQDGDSIQNALRNALDDGSIVFRREYLVGSNFFNEDDFLDYCDTNYATEPLVLANGDTVNVPVVFTGVEQDEFVKKYLAWI